MPFTLHRRRKLHSPFPRTLFWDTFYPERVALRLSARTISTWRHAAEAGNFFWLEKPRLIATSERFDTIQRPWNEMRRRAERALERRPDYPAIYEAYMTERSRRNLRPASEMEQLRYEVTELRNRLDAFEKAAIA